MTEPTLEIENLHIEYSGRDESIQAVNDADFAIEENEYFGLVGESGCGKSTLAHSILGGLDANGSISSGRIRYKGEEIQDFTEKELDEHIRWKEISLIPQSAMNSLDPLTRVSGHALELAEAHTNWSEEKTINELSDLFDVVGLPTSRIHDYPFQFSGGMKQRAIFALALLLNPSLIIADEPTTALDVIMQDKVIKHLEELRETHDVSLLLITHDISVVLELCDSMAVMHGGQIAESGSTSTIYDSPRHPYTILLQQAFPDIRYPKADLASIEGSPPTLRQNINYCTFADRCPWAVEECRSGAPPLEPVGNSPEHVTSCIRSSEMETLAEEYLDRDLQVEHADEQKIDDRESRETVLELDELHRHFSQSTNIIETIKNRIFDTESPDVRAVDGVNLELKEDEIQGIIGESGCGKSTLLRTIMGAYEISDGEILFKGDPVSEFTDADWRDLRRSVQIIMQDPFNSMNPHFTVRQTLMEPLKVHGIEISEDKLLDTLEEVRLSPPELYIDRTESELSGGEKQRVAIARALIIEPDVILADEPVSMLDVSTQASILELLGELTDSHEMSMVYISHDLSTVSYVCDRVNVMYLGRIVESAPTMDLLRDPRHPYTKALIDSIPVPDPHSERKKVDLPETASDASNIPTGCRFKDRCSERMDICDERPKFLTFDSERAHQVACHLYYDHGDIADSRPSAVATGDD